MFPLKNLACKGLIKHCFVFSMVSSLIITTSKDNTILHTVQMWESGNINDILN